MAWIGPEIWVWPYLSESRGWRGWKVLLRFMDTHIWHLPASSERVPEKEQWPLPELLSWRKLPLSGLTPMPDYLFPSSISLMFQHWNSEWVRSCKSMSRLFKRNAWGSRNTPPHSTTIWAGFYSQELWRLLFLALKALSSGLGVGLGPLAPQGGPLILRYPSRILTAGDGPGVLSFCPSYWSCSVASSYIFGCRISVQLHFRCFWMMVFCSLLVILMWLWEDSSTDITQVVILTRTPSTFYY